MAQAKSPSPEDENFNDLVIVGKPTERNEMEDFWMEKITNLERQYDEHMIRLQKSMFDYRMKAALVRKKEEEMEDMKRRMRENEFFNEKLLEEKEKLKKQVYTTKYENESTKKKLEAIKQVSETLKSQVATEKKQKREKESQLVTLKNQFGLKEKENKLIKHDLKVKDEERKRTEERLEKQTRQKFSLIAQLTDAEQERRFQMDMLTQLSLQMDNLNEVTRSKNEMLLYQRKELEKLMAAMESKQKEQDELFRKLNISKSHLHEKSAEHEELGRKLIQMNQQVQNWKEELSFEYKEKQECEKELKNSKVETSRLRCQLAAARHKLNDYESQLRLVQLKLRSKDTELAQTKRQQQNLQKTIEKNEIMNKKMAEKILKSHPYLHKHSGQSNNIDDSKSVNRTEEILHSYRRKVWELEQQKKNMEDQILKLKEGINKYSLKLEHLSAFKEKIYWQEKAMVKMEGMNKRLEAEMNVLAKRVPYKLPLEKLVSDPFALDRMARHKALQRRLAKETRQKEELKQQMKTLIKLKEDKSKDVPFDPIGELMRRAEERFTKDSTTTTNFTSSGASSSEDTNPYKTLPYNTKDNENIEQDMSTAQAHADRIEKRLKWIRGEAMRMKEKERIAQEAAQKRAANIFDSIEKVRSINSSFAAKSRESLARRKTQTSVLEYNDLDEISDIEDEPDYLRFSDDEDD